MLQTSMPPTLLSAYDKGGGVKDPITLELTAACECPEIFAQVMSSAWNAALTAIPHLHICTSRYFTANFNTASLVKASGISPLQAQP